MGFFID